MSTRTKKETLEFANQLRLRAIPYEWWDPGHCMITNDGPFWSYHDPVPSMDRIHSCNCAGLINLMRRWNNLEIPGVQAHDYYSGGTRLWCLYVESVREVFDPNRSYDTGTLFLRDFRDINDQGHLAVQYDENMIIHSRAGKGICMESIALVYGVFSFEYTVAYDEWMRNKNDFYDREEELSHAKENGQ